jgi:hypothetical protein
VYIEPDNFQNNTEFYLNAKDNLTLSFNIKTFNYLKVRESPTDTRIYDANSYVESVECRIDGNLTEKIGDNGNHFLPTDYSINLTSLTEGLHSIEIYAKISYSCPQFISETNYLFELANEGYSGKIFFTIEHSIDVSLPSLRNNTCTNSTVPLDFIINKPFIKIIYDLDGKNVTINGNTTLTGLPDGLHKLTIYVWDEKNRSETHTNIF